MRSCIQVNHTDAGHWLEANPVLAEGEFGLETDTRKLKVGDGVTAWDQLAYSIEIGAQQNPPQVTAAERTDARCADVRSFSPADVYDIARHVVGLSAIVDGGDAFAADGVTIDGGEALA